METPLVIKEAVEKAKKTPGYWAGQGAIMRASSMKGMPILAKGDLIKKRLKKTMPILGAGLGGGAGLGFIASLLSRGRIPKSIGALAGANVGGAFALIPQMIARNKIDKKYMGEKGITYSWLTGKVKGMTPEAKKKYLHKKYVGGGYERKKPGIPTIKQ